MNWLAGHWLWRDYVLPVLDILLLAFLIYRTYRILVQTRAVQLIKGALFMGLVYLAAFLLRLNTLRWVLNLLVPGLVIGMAIIFQPELRRVFTRLGQGAWFRLRTRVRSQQMEAVLNAELSSSLLLTIFAENAPLHDGAVVVSENRIVAAGCFLPLSEQPDIRQAYGSRHRAALGLAEETDAVVLVVSEENGAISLAHDANLLYDLTLEEASRRLKHLLELGGEEGEERYISVPVKLSAHAGLAVATPYPKSVRVTVRGKSDQVFSILEEDIAVTDDLSRFTTAGEFRVPLLVARKGTAQNLEPLDIRVEPSELRLTLEKEAVKSVEVNPLIKGQPAHGYELVQYSVTPSAVEVSGPRGAANALAHLDTEEVDISGATDDFSLTIPLLRDNPLLRYPREASVEFRFINKTKEGNP